jgi:hypothetical protein
MNVNKGICPSHPGFCWQPVTPDTGPYEEVNMQTSSKVTSAKKVGLLAGLLHAFLGSKSAKPIDSMGGKGHYFDGNGANGYFARSTQSQRRKMARRTGRVTG